MRVVFLAAGAAGMHCGACAGDVALARGLRRLGCDVILMPLYTPLTFDGEPPERVTRTFLGGINVYLQHRFGLFRSTPRWLDRLFDSRPALALASRVGVRTRAEELGPLTLAVLEGEQGAVRKELDRVLDFLDSTPADVIVLTNSLLSGLVPALKRRRPVPVVCRLQGEDEFANAMPEPYRSRVRDRMLQNAQSIDGFIAPDADYAAHMADFLGVPLHRVHPVRPGMEVDLYPPNPHRPRAPFVVGYLSRITPGKGLDVLVEALRILVAEELRDVRVAAAGKTVDRRFWREVRASVRGARLDARFDYLGEPGLAQKVAFLHRCSAFCVPSRYAELRGTAVLEAMAAGVPVVAPDLGVFREAAALTGGARLVPPGDPRALASALARLMDEPDDADALGLAGSRGVRIYYSAARVADETLDLLERVVASKGAAHGDRIGTEQAAPQ